MSDDLKDSKFRAAQTVAFNLLKNEIKDLKFKKANAGLSSEDEQYLNERINLADKLEKMEKRPSKDS